MNPKNKLADQQKEALKKAIKAKKEALNDNKIILK